LRWARENAAVSELGDLLELVHDADGAFSTLRAY